jgi:hypothetical protein
MHPSFARSLKQKKRRVRDPNLPPPPTLLGQVKELRLTKEEIDRLQLQIMLTQQRVEYLEASNRRLENSLESVQNWVKNRMR